MEFFQMVLTGELEEFGEIKISSKSLLLPISKSLLTISDHPTIYPLTMLTMGFSLVLNFNSKSSFLSDASFL